MCRRRRRRGELPFWGFSCILEMPLTFRGGLLTPQNITGNGPFYSIGSRPLCARTRRQEEGSTKNAAVWQALRACQGLAYFAGVYTWYFCVCECVSCHLYRKLTQIHCITLSHFDTALHSDGGSGRPRLLAVAAPRDGGARRHSDGGF